MKFHKKFHVVALLAAILALNAQAAEVSSAQVTRAVSAWAAANGSAFANPGSVIGATPVKDSDGTVLYWVVKMSNGGAVIASPDTDLDLVIAVLEKSDGTFPAGHPLPSILKKDMKNRLSIVRGGAASGVASSASGVRSASMLSVSTQSTSGFELPEAVKASVRRANAQWEKYGSLNARVNLLGESLQGGDASPYVRKIVDGFETGGRYTHWNQSESSDGKPLYNLYTPNNEVCGCVATAGAAIMQFFGENSFGKKHEDIGEVESTDEGGCSLHGKKLEGLKTMSGEVDWATIQLPDYSGNGLFATALSEEQRQLIGRITYNIGVLVGMSWAEDGPGEESGAPLSQLDDALKAYGFKSARYVSFPEGVTGTAQDPAHFRKVVFAQNWANAPVALGISYVDDEGKTHGHAVIACGYAKDGDDDEFSRVFMGWGGYGDAWYNLPGIEEYELVDEAITMIGFETDQVVPVCGKANVTNASLTIPNGAYSVEMDEESGEATVVTANLSVPVDGKGYFAARIPISMKNPVIEYTNPETSDVTSMAIAPFDSKVLEKEEDLTKLEAATPAEMMFLVLNMAVKSTVASAREVALRDNKALLMVSGAGSVREAALIDYITHLDDTEDLASRFVLVRVNSADDASGVGDGDPSIGVFDPADGSAELRWCKENGRLAYENFVDEDKVFDAGRVVYTFDAENTEVLTNSVDIVLAKGYDQYLRNHSGIAVSVVSVDADTGAAVVPAYGTYENCWTNGENAVFSAPSVYTNESAGIMYECFGWSTNALASVSNAVKGCVADIVLQADCNVTFSWLWKVKAYRVTARPATDNLGADAVTPSELWRVPGDRATVVANFAGFNGWTVYSGSSATGSELNPDNIDARDNGGAFSFTVREPVFVEAAYRDENGAPANPEEYSVQVSVNPEELAEFIGTGDSSLTLRDNTTYDPLASFAALASDITDATGGVWRCTGWVGADGVTNSVSGSYAKLNGSAQSYIELVWEYQEPVPEIVVLDPVPVSIGGVSQVDGKWAITIPNAKKGWKYYLYSSSDLSRLSGDSSSWPKDESVGENPQEATDDGNVVFKSIPVGGSMFWRAMEQEIRK